MNTFPFSAWQNSSQSSSHSSNAFPLLQPFLIVIYTPTDTGLLSPANPPNYWYLLIFLSFTLESILFGMKELSYLTLYHFYLAPYLTEKEV